MASAPTPYSDMMIESQDIDMSGGPLGGFTFPNGEMTPWLKYLPQGVLSYFNEMPDNGSGQAAKTPDDPGIENPKTRRGEEREGDEEEGSRSADPSPSDLIRVLRPIPGARTAGVFAFSPDNKWPSTCV